jgi:hypothetical protein
MAVDTTNLIAGPGKLMTALFGATEPADSLINAAYAASAFTDVGATQDGVTLNFDREFFELEVDQVVDVPGRRLTKRDLRIQTNLAEPTLTNLGVVLNGGTVTASAAYSTYDPADDTAATQPTYRAIMFEGFAPRGFRRWVFARKVISVDAVGVPYKKDGQALFPTSFACHYVSPSIKPFRIVDQTV